MELIDRLKEVLKEEFNICSDEELLEALQMIASEKWDGSLGATYFESESSSTWHRDNLNYLYSHGGHDFYIDREE